MTIDEIIKHYEQVLKELKAYREKQEISTDCVNNYNCNDCIHNSICTWRGAKFCDWYVQDCSDAISRQAVLEKAINVPIAKVVTEDKVIYRKIVFVDDIENLPSVSPQQRTGRWIRVTDKTGHFVWECDKCHWQQRFNTNFCPDCGAKIGVEE